MRSAARADRTGRAKGGLAFALVLLCLPFASAHAQFVDCDRLRAAIVASSHGDPEAAQRAAALRGDLVRLAARADAIGCNNHQFLFFGSPPPPECGGINQRLAAMRAQYEGLRVRAGDPGRRQQLIGQYAASCGPPPSETEAPVEPAPEEAGRHGGGEALCVRKCDGSFFPLSPSMNSAKPESLRDLCQALCPNAEIELFSRAANADISTAVSVASGDRYGDLSNALKFTKKFDPACSCRKPKQSWVEVLGPAEQILTEIDGDRPGEGPLTEKQADERSHGPPAGKLAQDAKPETPAKPKKNRGKPPISPLDPPAPF
jgi:hypothetical protein